MYIHVPQHYKQRLEKLIRQELKKKKMSGKVEIYNIGKSLSLMYLGDNGKLLIDYAWNHDLPDKSNANKLVKKIKETKEKVESYWYIC